MKKIQTIGKLKEMGVNELGAVSPVDLHNLLKYLNSVEPVKMSKSAYRFGNEYMIKFYPEGSFSFNTYCRGRHLPVEDVIAVGRGSHEGDILITGYIGDENYRKIVLRDEPNTVEMEALGKTLHLFSSNSVAAGDTKLDNYIYDVDKAVRIDLIPYENFSILGFPWIEMNGKLAGLDVKQKENWPEINNIINNPEYRDELDIIVTEVDSILLDLAGTFAHNENSKEKFNEASFSYLHGFVGDTLSSILSLESWKKVQSFASYMEKAEKESRDFYKVYIEEQMKSVPDGGKIIFRIFEH